MSRHPEKNTGKMPHASPAVRASGDNPVHNASNLFRCLQICRNCGIVMFMESDDKLLQRISACFRANLGKTVFSQAALLILQTVIITVTVVIIFMLPQTAAIIAGLPVLFASCASLLLFQYGFFVILYKLYTGKPAIFGDLFGALSDLKRISAAACFFILIETGCVIVIAGLFFAATAALPNLTADSFRLLSLFAAGYALLLITAVFPFAFVWFELFLHRSMTAFSAFASSARLLKGNKLHLLIFVCKSAGAFLLIAVVIYGFNIASMLEFLTSETGDGGESSGIFMRIVAFFSRGSSGRIFSMLYYIAAFTAIIKAGYAVAAFYLRLTGYSERIEETQSRLPPVIYLPVYTGDDSGTDNPPQ
jgi:hypothetical protein